MSRANIQDDMGARGEIELVVFPENGIVYLELRHKLNSNNRGIIGLMDSEVDVLINGLYGARVKAQEQRR